MSDTTRIDLPDSLLAYFAIRERQRAATIQRTLDTLTPYQRQLVREAAVMGYVRGAMSQNHRAEIPGDVAIVADVVSACVSMSDLYPMIYAASEGVRRRPKRRSDR